MSISNNRRLYKYKKYYIYIFIIFTLLLTSANYINLSNKFISIAYDFISLAGILFLLFYGSNLLVNDKRLNQENSVISSPFFKYSIVLLVYLFILSLFHRTAFEGYNNSFYLFHSLMFLYIILIYGDKYKWIRNTVRISMIFIFIISIISVSNILLYLFVKLGLATNLQNESLKTFILLISPRNGEFVGLFNKNESFTHLLAFTIYLYFFAIVYYKKSFIKYILTALVLVNFLGICLFKNDALCFSVITTSIIYLIIYFFIYKTYNHKNDVFSSYMLILFAVLIILQILYIIFSTSNFAYDMRVFCKELFTLKWVENNQSKLYLYKEVIKNDKSILFFGANSTQIYSNLIINFPDQGEAFLNNNNFFNLYMDFLIRNGIIASISLVILFVISMVNILKGYVLASFRRKRFIICFLFQIILILVTGIFNQFPLFKMNMHSLILIYCFGSLVGLTYFEERDYSARL